MTNLPRGTDVISRAASHHTEQGRAGAVQRLAEGPKEEGERGREADPGQGCHQAAAQKTWSSQAAERDRQRQ